MGEVFEEDLKSTLTLPLFSMGSMKAQAHPGEETVVAMGQLEVISKRLEERLREELDSMPEVTDEPTFHDSLFYIFTSGTTGLPKATITKHSRRG